LVNTKEQKMENLSGKLQKTINYAQLAKQKEIKERWSVLFIGDHGKTFAVKHFKLIIILALTFLVSSILTSGLFIFLYKEKADKYEIIKNRLSTINITLSSLKKENELLLTRAVTAELQLKENKKKSRKELRYNSQNMQVLSIRDFTIGQNIDSGNLKIKFKIKNIASDLVPIRGYIFVIMKREAEKEATWLTFPYTRLSSGKPSPYTKGRRFIIEFWKEMSLNSGIREPAENFEEATIIVFNTKGDSIFKKNFVIKDIINGREE